MTEDQSQDQTRLEQAFELLQQPITLEVLAQYHELAKVKTDPDHGEINELHEAFFLSASDNMTASEFNEAQEKGLL
ncbi:hypothetical protein [uncultured Shewanella sp.]|uniref:hypothetical protein n=1 Tax=uncultured Shewanella sp. TaxID=173975 RepID=UPI0026199148|nr:hypothetical protein [uncultured Shewanella sp.]